MTVTSVNNVVLTEMLVSSSLMMDVHCVLYETHHIDCHAAAAAAAAVLTSSVTMSSFVDHRKPLPVAAANCPYRLSTLNSMRPVKEQS